MKGVSLPGDRPGGVSVTSHALVAGRLGRSPRTDARFVLLAMGRVVLAGV